MKKIKIDCNSSHIANDETRRYFDAVDSIFYSYNFPATPSIKNLEATIKNGIYYPMCNHVEKYIWGSTNGYIL